MKRELFIGAIFVVLGLLFFFNSKNISKGASKFYQEIFAEKNLKIIFKACGIILILIGFVLMFTI